MKNIIWGCFVFIIFLGSMVTFSTMAKDIEKSLVEKNLNQIHPTQNSAEK
jgi:fluoride ion exporter CrcB/FEX